MYTSGIYEPPANCGSFLNHGVLLVGIKKIRDHNSYFIVKNSWGENWGEKGYIRMATGTGSGNCGIANSWDVIPIV